MSSDDESPPFQYDTASFVYPPPGFKAWMSVSRTCLKCYTHYWIVDQQTAEERIPSKTVILKL